MASVSSPNRSQWKWLKAAAAVWFFIPAPLLNARDLAVSAIRFWPLGDVTRVAIEITGEFEYRYDRVYNPDRLYFDILGAQSLLQKRGTHVIPVGDRLLKQIRIALTQPNVTRVVLDLEPSVDFICSQLANPNRLMIELRTAAAGGKLSSGTPAEPVAVQQEPPATPAPPPTPSDAVEASVKPPASAAPARVGGAGQQSLTRVLGLKVARIVIDAGHGGHDTGTIGPGGLMEKDVVLDIAKRLGTLIQTKLGSEVVYTRSDDTFVALEERTKLANEKKADLFLSIHANSSRLRSIAGVETFYLNLTSSKEDLDVAARENAASQQSIFELQNVIQKIALTDKIEESREFAANVQKALYSALSRRNSRVRNRGVKKAPFIVLIGAQMPSILTEIGFISHPREEALMKRPEHRQKIAEAIFKGLSAYASTLSHFEVAQTTTR
ncbi:MAG TPA: N-acetylmuramoyl-L-alanine amidase [Bryobacteraceae bacterium]|nr:N-acetylmuramoyl-L-alanine amidase [Bryobacteraceae bacterium]